jgi:hypothetical protein
MLEAACPLQAYRACECPSGHRIFDHAEAKLPKQGDSFRIGSRSTLTEKSPKARISSTMDANIPRMHSSWTTLHAGCAVRTSSLWAIDPWRAMGRRPDTAMTSGRLAIGPRSKVFEVVLQP